MDIKLRKADLNDLQLYFDWANDDLVRANSFYSDQINFENHVKWFNSKINSTNSLLFIFENNNVPVGQVRFEIEKTNSIIGISIDKNFRGKGLGVKMLKISTNEFFKLFNLPVYAYIRLDNQSSKNIFLKAQFTYSENDTVNGVLCEKFELKK